MAPGQNLALVVEGPDALADVIAETCRVAFSPRFSGVEILDEIPAQSEGAILVLEFTDAGLLWTPVYGRAQAFTVKAAYASQGEMDWRHESPVVLSSEEAPMIRSDGSVTISGRSWGLMTRPGFYQTVANPLATKLLSHLEDLYEIPGS
jgi:hypothetical protein